MLSVTVGEVGSEADDRATSRLERALGARAARRCFVAQQVESDLEQGTWSAPGSDTVSEGSSTITFSCSTVGQDNTQDAHPPIYRCVSEGDPQDWFEFEFT